MKFTDPDAPFYRILGEVLGRVTVVGIALAVLIWIYSLCA